ncbi:class I SAM-dependent methyltransferase [Alphaproteobacteria bacterium]|nr:class I SAM-dependent methyltransferase [Alphaproteobacteria bacterium]
MSDVNKAIDSDNSSPDLGARIVRVLEEAGIPPEQWTPDMLGPADQIHGGGLLQTQFHTSLTNINAGMNLLDIGCGIGGPARYFATEFGCRVTGIDLTSEYIEAARMLTEKTGLSNRVKFDCGDANSLPYEDGEFDMVWALNVTMNIKDRAALYRNIHQVLSPNGTVAISELGQGKVGEPYYPLPWARDSSYSFLIPPEEMRGMLEDTGFRVLKWVDEVTRRQEAPRLATPTKSKIVSPLSLEITRGNDYPARRANAARSMKEGRLTNVMLIAEKSDT